MNPTDKYIREYCENFDFDFCEKISSRIFDVEAEIDVFEYRDERNYREKAHAILKKGALTYECELCDEHNYPGCFCPVVLNGKRFLFFRKTLYGFTLINAETLLEEFEYFPASVAEGGESFIITEVKQLSDLLIFEGCYWAYPYECFAFDYEKKLFSNLSEACGIFYVEKTELRDNSLTIYGTDENGAQKQGSFSAKTIANCIQKHGKADI